MLSSFFSKSKPINYIVVGVYMLILYSIATYLQKIEVKEGYILVSIAGAFLYLASMLLLNFVAQKNDLTNKGTFTILLYAFLTAILPNSLTNASILVSNVFVLLALQNVLHLRNEKQIKAKIFNASFCIGLASLAYFWSIGFIILVFLGIFYFCSKDYRNWIVPFIGLSMIFLFANCFTLAVYDSFFTFNTYIDSSSFLFQNYVSKESLFSVGLLSICIVFFFTIYLIKFNRKTAYIKPVLKLVMATLFIAIGIAIFSPTKDTSELLFIAAPLALMGTTYLEMDYRMYAKEINLWVFVIIPFGILLL